jgi:NRPS condensation-like uncharacterized protein
MKPAYYRLLGAMEQALWLRDLATPLHFVLVAQVSGNLQPTALIQALDRLQKRHPLLRVRITFDQNKKPWFVEQQAAIPCRIMIRQGDQHWQEVAARELQQPFTCSDAPLIRVVLLHSSQISELVVVCHHAIADGLAAINLIEELLSLLGNPDHVMTACSVPLSLEALFPHYQPAQKVSKFLAWGLLQGKQFTQWLKQKSDRMLPQSVSDAWQVDSEMLSSETTTALIQRCHQERTTVHAAICMAVLFAIFLNQEPSAAQTLNCFAPINLRSYLQSDSKQACGLYIAPALTTHTVGAESLFWQTVRSLKSNLKAQGETNYLLKLIQQNEILIGANPNPEMLQQVFLERYASDFMVTNLGRLKIPQQFGHLRLQAIYGPVVLSGFAEERVFGIATLDDCLYFTLTYSSSNSKSLLEQVLLLLEQAIVMPDFTLSTATQLLLQSTTSPSKTELQPQLQPQPQLQLSNYGRV